MRLPNLLIICNSIINSRIYVILNFYVLINLIFFKYEQIMFLIILKKHRKKSNNPYIELFSDINVKMVIILFVKFSTKIII